MNLTLNRLIFARSDNLFCNWPGISRWQPTGDQRGQCSNISAWRDMNDCLVVGIDPSPTVVIQVTHELGSGHEDGPADPVPPQNIFHFRRPATRRGEIFLHHLIAIHVGPAIDERLDTLEDERPAEAVTVEDGGIPNLFGDMTDRSKWQVGHIIEPDGQKDARCDG